VGTSSVSGIGVLDKAVAVLDALELSPMALAELSAATGLPRATAHRLAVALEVHGFVERDGAGRFALGDRVVGGRSLAAAARPALERLRDATGESAQLYVPRGDVRVCVVSLESPHSLRTIVPVGAELPMDVGSAAKVFAGRTGRRGWAESVEEREKGVASVSAPVVRRDGDGDGVGDGEVVAAVSVSGPIERTTRTPGRRYARAVVAAAAEVAQAISR
jgi:DNA-binding IclR family transcriptional regulator